MSHYFEVLQRSRGADLFPPNVLLPVAPTKPIPSPIVHDEPRPANLSSGRAREELARLVQQLFLISAEKAPRAVLFCGVEQSEGSSRICARAGRILAEQAAGRVCLVDLDLRAPSLHRHVWAENRHGLADSLVEAGPIRGFARALPGGNWWIVPGGSVPPHADTVSNAERLRTRIAELRAEFDYVLLHAPPAGRYADAVLLGNLTDGVVLVVEANATRRETTLKVKESFEAAHVRLLGAVLDQRTFPIPEALYRRL